MKIKSVMDSGAAESVAPPSMASGVRIEDSPGSRLGQHYISASKQRLPNVGQQRVKVVTNERRNATVLYQIVEEVSRPLTAVSATRDAGNVVVFGPKGGVIHNVYTGERTRFQRSGGIYELELWMKSEQARRENCEHRPFPRQGA